MLCCRLTAKDCGKDFSSNFYNLRVKENPSGIHLPELLHGIHLQEVGGETVNQHHVHIFVIVRLKTGPVEAETHEGAIEKAKEVFDDLYGLFEPANIRRLPPDLGTIEFGEEFSHFLVDEAGDDEFEKSTWHGPDGQPTQTTER